MRRFCPNLNKTFLFEICIGLNNILLAGLAFISIISVFLALI